MNSFKLLISLIYAGNIIHSLTYSILLSRVNYKFNSLSRLFANTKGVPRLINRNINPDSGDYSYDYWSKAFDSQLNEFDYEIVDIDGEIPPSLFGTVFRSMPARFERGGKVYGHYLDGDGYIIRLSLNKGRASFKSSFIKTREYIEESERDKILFRSTFRTQREPSPTKFFNIDVNNAFDLKLKNSANTNSVFWADKLMIFFEAGVPHSLSPYTLETLGEDNMEIALKSGMSVLVPAIKKISSRLHDTLFGASMTAHPKIDPIKNSFVSWIWRAEVDPAKGPLDTRPVLSIYEWDETMRVIKNEVNYKLEKTTVSPHDFSITKNYYVFIENRVQGDTLPYLLGTKCPAQCVDIVPNEPMIINLVPRNNVNDKKSIPYTSSLDPGFTIHSVCAFENLTKNASPSPSPSPSSSSSSIDKDSGTIELITTGWKTETVASGTVKGGLLGSWEGKAPLFDNIPVTLLYHTILDLETLQLISHSPAIGMENTIVEHPHINPLFESSVVRYLFMSIGSVKGKSSPPLGYLKLDIKTGEKSVWYAPEHTYCEELIVVPKYQAKVIDKNIMHEEEDEDDVWLIGCLFDAVEERSYFAIFDGKFLTAGPIARLWLSHHLPHSLHGSFVSKIFDHNLI